MIDLPDGEINNVFYVRTLPTNFLSIFQITHSNDGKTIEFLPRDVVTRYINDLYFVIALGHVPIEL
jgi:hypothetical protein